MARRPWAAALLDTCGLTSLARCPGAVLSSVSHPDAVFHAMRSGADDYLVKPVGQKDLQGLWQHVWRRKHAPLQRVPSQLGLEDLEVLASAPANDPSVSRVTLCAHANTF